MIIDSHHHLWRYLPRDYPWIDRKDTVLARDYTPEDYIEVLKSIRASDSPVQDDHNIQDNYNVQDNYNAVGVSCSERRSPTEKIPGIPGTWENITVHGSVVVQARQSLEETRSLLSFAGEKALKGSQACNRPR